MKLPQFFTRLEKPEAATSSKPPVSDLRISKWPFVVRRVQGHSMVPVLPPNTTVWAWRWFQDLKAGDVVIFFHDGREKIKRISQLTEQAVHVLGDHPETSTDSRHFGWVPRQEIIAKVIWPHADKERAEVTS